MNSNKSFKSFGEWCKENDKQICLDYWADELSPYEVSCNSGRRIAFWCGNPDHPVFYRQPHNIVNRKGAFTCPGCTSFGQYIIDNFGRDYLDAIWSDKNTENPFVVQPHSTNKKIWIRCLENENHPDYETLPGNFLKGARCPYCDGKKVCYDNSLAKAMPEIIDLWSDKNELGPDKYAPASDAIVWLKCSKHKHEDFQRRIGNIKFYGYECPECTVERVADDRREDLTGQTFGRLTVLGPDPDDSSRCICQCSCENHTIKSIAKNRLKSGKTTSCGCYHMERVSGENSHLWKGGITEHNQEGRYTWEYRAFREDVMKRDNYTCQCCGDSSGTDLEVHHIRNYSNNEDLRYNTLNGITLCKRCHSQNFDGSFHRIYGVTNNTPEQLEDFINDKREELGIEEHFSLDEYIRESKEKENMANERECKICKATYKYCPHCSSFKNAPKWMALFDKEVCKEVFDIISGYNTGSIAPEDAKAKLAELDLTGIEFKDNIQAKIDEINGNVNQISEQVDNADGADSEPQKIEYKPGRGRKRKKAEEPVAENQDAEEIPTATSGFMVTDLDPEIDNDFVTITAEAVENVNNDVFEE